MKTKLLTFIFSILLITINAQTFTNTIGGGITDDNAYNYYPIAVSGLPTAINTSTFGIESITINVLHTNDVDLRMKLQSPAGSIYVLTSFNGGTGNNYTNTVFNDSAATSISSGMAPFTGIFKPTEALASFNNGQNPNGNWNLMIRDQTVGEVGNVISWNIKFSNTPAGYINFTSSNLPIVIINTGGVAIPNEPKIDATMGIIYNGVGMINNINDSANNYNGNIGIEIRGAYSASLPQKPYGIETRDALNGELNVSLLNMPEEHDWCLIANYNDKAFMRNTLPYKLFSEMGHYGARSQFCEVVLNGSYQGIYLLMESIKRDSNRVDIAKLDSTENTGINVTGGYIIKNDYWDSSNSWLLNYHPIDHPTFNVNLVYDYPKPTSITPQQKTYIQTYINDFETALYGANFADTLNGYKKYISTKSFIDYLIINELARNNDGFKKSSYFHKDNNTATAVSKLKAGPVWDFDWAWKNINECSIFSATDGSGWAHHINDCGPDVNSTGWFVRLMQDTVFQNTLRCRWEYFRSTILSSSNLNNYIDSISIYLNAAQNRHFQRWGNLGVSTGTPEMEADPTTFAGQITKFKDWIDLRIAWLDLNIPGNTFNCDFTSVEEIETSPANFSFFPNPANDNLTVFSNTTDLINQIELFDINGKLIMKINVNANQVSINVTDLSNGIYICKVYNSSAKIKTEKIVLIH
jgi:hypothetical protein